ncbi:MAG: AmmeMemoRadiSam system radical SAM enzyme [Methanomicrobiaceae archaeon]|nr:AmmeMemoRadiSam system radical SAM enzyme [Methanomicrobiaceae archaeon]
MSHIAELFEKIDGGGVRCSVCSHRCKISEGNSGICGMRVNRGGTLYADNYSKVVAEASDPIEKKPLYHFLPGTKVYSLGGLGCNFHCTHCQNWQISQDHPGTRMVRTISPEEGVERALITRCRSIAWTYNEPTIWHEYAKDMGILAKKESLGTVYVTNGYMTEEALNALSPMLDAFRVDLKSFSDDFYRNICGARLQPVLDSTIRAKELGMHIETVTLVIPGVNDSMEEMSGLVSWVIENLGPEIPMHFTAFHPDFRMTDVPATPVKTLENIHDMAVEKGVQYVYTGNIPTHPYNNTYCYECGSLLIERSGFTGAVRGLDGDACSKCGTKIPIVMDIK